MPSKTIGDLMSTNIETVGISATAHDVAKRMKDREVSSLIVTESGKSIGIVTERDLVRRVCATDARSKDVPVKQIMSSPIFRIDPFSSAEVAADNMIRNKIRHLLVEDENGKPLGMITLTDLAAFMKENVNMDDVNATILEALKEEGRYA